MRQYVIGDIHGRCEALVEVLKKCRFDYAHDKLIVLGDVVDGGRESRQAIEHLLTIKNIQMVAGNHDTWFLEWCDDGGEFPTWTHQGGYATMESYGFDYKSVPKAHIELFRNAPYYFIDEENRIYVHGGFDPTIPIEKQTKEFITWDRDMCGIAKASASPITKYKHIFVGHTTTNHPVYGGEAKPLTRDQEVYILNTKGVRV